LFPEPQKCLSLKKAVNMDTEKRLEALEQLTHIQEKQIENLNKRLQRQEELMKRTAVFMLVLFIAVFVLYYKLFL